MTDKWIEGLGRQLKGGLKETLGRVIGDVKLTADGAAERALGATQASAAGPHGQIVPEVVNDRITGVGHQFKGGIEEIVGDAVGNRILSADGRGEYERGKAQDTAGSARDAARQTSEFQQAKHDPATPAALQTKSE
jgi:uncharacterized protein YjbJ (UPF0337 family)